MDFKRNQWVLVVTFSVFLLFTWPWENWANPCQFDIFTKANKKIKKKNRDENVSSY